jgi:guanylate kinase
MYKIVAIIGEAGSGKDTILRFFMEKQKEKYNKITPTTTRPMRDGELEGKEYYFCSNEEFLKKVKENKMLEHTTFNNWYYGTGIDTLDINNINIGIFNPKAIRSIIENKQCDILVIHIKASDTVRMQRQLEREDYPDVKEIARRFLADCEDFKELNFPHITIINEAIEDFWKAIKDIQHQVEEHFGQNQ